MFVRWSCGCVGLSIPRTGDIVIKDCRADYPEDLGFMLRPEGLEKEATPLSPDEIRDLCEAMRICMSQAGAYRDLCRSLSVLQELGHKKPGVRNGHRR